jgi:hypothetical protein
VKRETKKPRGGIHAMKPIERSPATDTGMPTTAADLRVRQLVRVLACGKWRPAQVLKINRTTATVRIVMNQKGREAVRRERFRWIMVPAVPARSP